MHVQKWILKAQEILPASCSADPESSCVQTTGVMVFDFLTIPFMALIVFIFVIWMNFLAGRALKNETK